MGETFDARDRELLQERGISEQEALRQLELLRRPQAYARLVGACSRGNGIVVLDDGELDRLSRRFDEARSLRSVKFVPASGAATRMFRDLLFFRGQEPSWESVEARAAEGGAEAASLLRFRERLEDFAFHALLRGELRRRAGRGTAEADPAELLVALLDADGLAYAELPKGLLKFHRLGDQGRTPFEEHLVEAVDHARDANGTCRLHFTVSPQHLERFRALLAEAGPACEHEHGVTLEVGFSEQKPATDTLAVDAEGRPFRDAEGRLLFRPGGHGALIENLGEIDGDVVFVKNIDNVQPEHARGDTLRYKRALGGLLVELRQSVNDLVRRLRDDVPGATGEALAFLATRLEHDVEAWSGNSTEERRRLALDRLDRPLRVCGVVPNTGEPGGGPFWVKGAGGVRSRQIVETAQIDPDSAEQQSILKSATHFNPVDLVCAITDADGRRYDLRRFIDPDAVIVARKSAGGRDLTALERPGLWNGAMAGWNTVFVEVPLTTFTPVKTVLDLLRPEHQPAG
jgi:hypothetical protein